MALKPDVIEWILKLNTSQVQEEYHKLEKENKNLQSQLNANRKKWRNWKLKVKKKLGEKSCRLQPAIRRGTLGELTENGSVDETDGCINYDHEPTSQKAEIYKIID